MPTTVGHAGTGIAIERRGPRPPCCPCPRLTARPTVSTAEVGDDVLVYRGVTLGNDVPRDGKRHPTVGDDVMLGANATVLGPIEVGDGATVGAAAVVVDAVDPGVTVVGNPARPVSESGACADDGPMAPVPVD